MNHIIRTEKRNISIEEGSIETNDDNISLAQKKIYIYQNIERERTTGRIIYIHIIGARMENISNKKRTNEQGLGRKDQTLGNNNNMIST